ncbi:ribosomal protein L29 family protein [Zea mays]|uniref:Large ribosomal subunit protein uL29m n=1 Tax=Zea mays TaxID=4577 RepID=A0A1D6NSS3_MAIZE|nr:ribosomal protein L29 family protein [Zea mays]
MWYVLLKEKNMLMTQRQMLQSDGFPNPERISKVKKSMCRIKHVLTERAIAEPDPRRSSEMKRMINAVLFRDDADHRRAPPRRRRGWWRWCRRRRRRADPGVPAPPHHQGRGWSGGGASRPDGHGSHPLRS